MGGGVDQRNERNGTNIEYQRSVSRQASVIGHTSGFRGEGRSSTYSQLPGAVVIL